MAFSLGRALGPAVTRNRLRRRLRAILRDIQATLPGGALLIGATPRATELTFDQLRLELERLLAKAMSTSMTKAMAPSAADPADRT